jgi:hypothetical protein
LSFRYQVIGLGLLSACAGTTATSRGPSRGAADTVPPRIVRGGRFHLSYPAPLLTVGVSGSVVIRAVVAPTGVLDTATVRFDSASNAMFKAGVRESLVNLDLSPARSIAGAVPGTLVLKVSFQLERCDTTGGPQLEWSTESVPPMIALRQCMMPRGWISKHVVRLPHVTLTGRWSTGFGGDVLYPCASEKLPMAYPQFIAPLISLDFHDVHEWPRVIKLVPPGGPQVKYFMRMEGSLAGPDAVGQFGMAAFIFRPTRVLSAALWSERSCPLRSGAPD